MRPILMIILTVTAAGLCASPAQAQRPAVVELFTSEGCNSCPPAELYLGELARRPDVLALAFHVDYWDDLGWRDRFVIPEATPRQRGYARAMRLPSVYTPQVVIDGTGNFVGNDRANIVNALRRSARTGVPVRIAVLEGSIGIDLGAQTAGVVGDVLLIAFERSAVSAIGRGENAGRTLNEYNIVRSMKQLGRYEGSQQTYRVDLSSLPKDATDIAVIVQASGQQAVLGDASHPIR